MNAPLEISDTALEILQRQGTEDRARTLMARMYSRLLEADVHEGMARALAEAIPFAMTVAHYALQVRGMRKTLTAELDDTRHVLKHHPKRRRILDAIAEIEAIARPT